MLQAQLVAVASDSIEAKRFFHLTLTTTLPFARCCVELGRTLDSTPELN
jgi:hypothetical protein